MSKAIRIDAEKREISVVECDGTLAWLQAQVGGNIERAWTGPKDETMYVNEEGMYQFTKGFLFAGRRDQPMWGSAVVVGRELSVTDLKYADVDTSLTALETWRTLVRFCDVPKSQ